MSFEHASAALAADGSQSRNWSSSRVDGPPCHHRERSCVAESGQARTYSHAALAFVENVDPRSNADFKRNTEAVSARNCHISAFVAT